MKENLFFLNIINFFQYCKKNATIPGSVYADNFFLPFDLLLFNIFPFLRALKPLVFAFFFLFFCHYYTSKSNAILLYMLK